MADRVMTFDEFKALATAPASPETSLTLRTSEVTPPVAQPGVMERVKNAARSAIQAGAEAGRQAVEHFVTQPVNPPVAPTDVAGRVLSELVASTAEQRPTAATPFDLPRLATGAGPEGRDVAAFAARTAPGLIANPLISGPVSGATEAAMQLAESGKITSPGQVALATVLPPGGTAVPRLGRAINRTLTRAIPGRFEAAQRTAREAAQEMVAGFRPPAGQIAASGAAARAAGGDLVQTKNIAAALSRINIPATPANHQLEAVRTTMENLRTAIKAQNIGGRVPKGGPKITLDDLEAIRRDIGPLAGRSGSPAEIRDLYGAMVQDLDATANAGGAGAQAARRTAEAFKKDLGASKVNELIEKATTNRVISGAEVPALNVATFMKLTRDPKTRKQLGDWMGPDALRVVDRFVREFRSLPPDVAFNGWGRLVLTVGGGAGGALSGGAIAGLPGAMIGAVTPELLTNFAVVGRNPAQLNRAITTALQAARAGYVASGGRE